MMLFVSRVGTFAFPSNNTFGFKTNVISPNLLSLWGDCIAKLALRRKGSTLSFLAAESAMASFSKLMLWEAISVGIVPFSLFTARSKDLPKEFDMFCLSL